MTGRPALPSKNILHESDTHLRLFCKDENQTQPDGTEGAVYMDNEQPPDGGLRSMIPPLLSVKADGTPYEREDNVLD